MTQNISLPALILKPKREKSLLQKHPWIFSGAVETHPKAESGDLVEVFQDKGAYLGTGFYDANSQIICRMVHLGKDKVEVNEDFWFQKLKQAYEIRQKYVKDEQTNAYRLIHAEGDSLPGLIADVYGEVVVLQILIKGTEKIYPHLLAGLHKLGFKHIYLKNKENTQRFEKTSLGNGWLSQEISPKVNILEYGLGFEVNVEEGQKTGFFLDQRENRHLLMKYAHQKTVLNAFGYTGGFSVYALAGGAKHVHSVDISKDATALCEQNVKSNFGEDAPHTALSQDCFEYLKNTTEKYEVMVLDPPAFAKNKRSVKNAIRGYISLNELGLKKIVSGGILFTFSCSGSIDRDTFRKIIFTACANVGREVRILHQITQPLDHPVNIYHPEGEYLKGLVLHVI
jgi:23S rRNA (cytosine1962-C5)-methyltransferase